VLQAGTPRGDVPELCGPYVTCDNRFVRRGRADASGTGMLAEPGRDGLTTRLRIVPVELCGEEHLSPTGVKIVQTELDRLARDEAGGEGGSDAPFSSASTGIAHLLAFFRKSMFNPPDFNGLTATLKSS
jgi:hypothetical protein